MKCLYYLTATLDSVRNISDDLHQSGINDWFIHALSKDEAGLARHKIHSSNYLEQLDFLRYGMIGALAGLFTGLITAGLLEATKPFGPEMPSSVYFILIVFMTLLGSWEGGLAGIASENKKIALFHDEIESGNYLILIYAKQTYEDIIKKVMADQHPEANLAAEDTGFYNPLSGLKRISL